MRLKVVDKLGIRACLLPPCIPMYLTCAGEMDLKTVIPAPITQKKTKRQNTREKNKIEARVSKGKQARPSQGITTNTNKPYDTPNTEPPRDVETSQQKKPTS